MNSKHISRNTSSSVHLVPDWKDVASREMDLCVSGASLAVVRSIVHLRSLVAGSDTANLLNPDTFPHTMLNAADRVCRALGWTMYVKGFGK